MLARWHSRSIVAIPCRIIGYGKKRECQLPPWPVALSLLGTFPVCAWILPRRTERRNVSSFSVPSVTSCSYFTTLSNTDLAACSVFFFSLLARTTKGCIVGWTQGSA